MADATHPIMYERAGLIPAQASLGMAANILLLEGQIVTVDSDGRADVPTNGQNAAGLADHTFDNRTTAPEGGGADAVTAEVSFGVFKLAYTGTAPVAGSVLYVVDNQTVGIDSNGGVRGIAGYCVDVIDATYCMVWMGSYVVGQIVIAATEAAQLDTAQTDITNLQTDVAIGFLPIPVTAGVLTASGGPLVAFADGVNDGLDYSEGVGYHWDAASTAGVGYSVPLPQNLDATADVEIHALVARLGANDTTANLDLAGYFQVPAAARTADDDVFGGTGVLGPLAAATTLVTEYSDAIAAADVPAAPCVLSFSLAPDAALDQDEAVMVGLWLEFAIALTT